MYLIIAILLLINLGLTAYAIKRTRLVAQEEVNKYRTYLVRNYHKRGF